jgi:NADH-quinone oxidoreductase subunit J
LGIGQGPKKKKMALHTILFNLFASIAIAAACGVIISKNPIYSLMFLILVFCNATGLLLLFKIELLAMMFIIIYVGAIAVLFLFVVMMLNIKMKPEGMITKEEAWGNNTRTKEEKKKTENKEKWTTKIKISTIIIIAIAYNVWIDNKIGLQGIAKERIKQMEKKGDITESMKQLNQVWEEYYQIEKPWTTIIETVTNIQAIGRVMYTYYSYYFMTAGMILLVAMIGAIVLTMYKRKNAWKKQMVYEQVNRGQESLKMQ